MPISEATREKLRAAGRKGGQARASQFTRESQQAARANVKRASLVSAGLKGHQACEKKYGAAYAARRLAHWRTKAHTQLERTVCGWLDALWLIYTCEVELVPGKVYADIVLRHNNRRIVIECDGAIWHTDDPLHGEQRQAHDVERDAKIIALGYELLHLKETAILDGSARDQLVAFLGMA